MNKDTIICLYLIFGLFTTILGIRRTMTNKTDTPTELIVWSWFIFWWIYLPIYYSRLIINKIKL